MKKFFAILGGLVALAGAAAAVLYFLKRRGLIDYECSCDDDEYDDIDDFMASEGEGIDLESLECKVDAAADAVKDKAADVAGGIERAVGAAADAAKDKAAELRDKVEDIRF